MKNTDNYEEAFDRDWEAEEAGYEETDEAGEPIEYGKGCEGYEDGYEETDLEKDLRLHKESYKFSRYSQTEEEYKRAYENEWIDWKVEDQGKYVPPIYKSKPLYLYVFDDGCYYYGYLSTATLPWWDSGKKAVYYEESISEIDGHHYIRPATKRYFNFKTKSSVIKRSKQMALLYFHEYNKLDVIFYKLPWHSRIKNQIDCLLFGEKISDGINWNENWREVK